MEGKRSPDVWPFTRVICDCIDLDKICGNKTSNSTLCKSISTPNQDCPDPCKICGNSKVAGKNIHFMMVTDVLICRLNSYKTVPLTT